MTNKKEMSQADWTYLVPGVVIPCLKIELETIPAQLFFYYVIYGTLTFVL